MVVVMATPEKKISDALKELLSSDNRDYEKELEDLFKEEKELVDERTNLNKQLRDKRAQIKTVKEEQQLAVLLGLVKTASTKEGKSIVDVAAEKLEQSVASVKAKVEGTTDAKTYASASKKSDTSKSDSKEASSDSKSRIEQTKAQSETQNQKPVSTTTTEKKNDSDSDSVKQVETDASKRAENYFRQFAHK